MRRYEAATMIAALWWIADCKALAYLWLVAAAIFAFMSEKE